MSRELPPCDHDGCPPSHCLRSGELAPAPGSVWIVTWHSQDSRASGVHGAFGSEKDARDAAEGMTAKTKGSVYRASCWMVRPNRLVTPRPGDQEISDKRDEAAQAAIIAWEKGNSLYLEGVRDALAWVMGDLEDGLEV